MKFIKGQKYQVVSASADHMCVAVNKKGLVYIAEPNTRNEVIGRIELTDELEYLGRVEGRPTFQLPDGTQVAGHPNNFDPESEYVKDKLRNRNGENAANTKPERIRDSAAAMFKALLARDPKMAAALALELDKLASERLADLVIDGLDEDEDAEDSDDVAAA